MKAAVQSRYRHRSGRWATIVALVGATGACVPTGLPETVLPAQVRYACRDGTLLEVVRSPDGQVATANVGGKSVRLMRTDSAAQEKYSDGASTLYLDGDRALFTSDSFVVAGPCVSTVALPVAQPFLPKPN